MEIYSLQRQEAASVWLFIFHCQNASNHKNVSLTGLFSTAPYRRPTSPLQKHKGMQQLFHLICPLKRDMHWMIRTLIMLGHLLWSRYKLHETTAGGILWPLSGERRQFLMHSQLHSFSLWLNHPVLKRQVWSSHICSWTSIALHVPSF